MRCAWCTCAYGGSSCSGGVCLCFVLLRWADIRGSSSITPVLDAALSSTDSGSSEDDGGISADDDDDDDLDGNDSDSVDGTHEGMGFLAVA